ncbi:hypothetical protein GCM10027073_57090 [Streptomyces chlorus]
MDEQMHVIGLAVELAQLHIEAGAHLTHDLLAPPQHVVIKGAAPVLGDEHQVSLKVVNNVTTGTNIMVWFPAR